MLKNTFFISEKVTNKNKPQVEPIKPNAETGKPEIFIDETTKKVANKTEPIQINQETGNPEIFVSEK